MNEWVRWCTRFLPSRLRYGTSPGKLASLPLASLLGGAPRELTAYASLLRYTEPELLSQRATDRVGSRVRGRCQLWSNRLSGTDVRFNTACTRRWILRVLAFGARRSSEYLRISEKALLSASASHWKWPNSSPTLGLARAFIPLGKERAHRDPASPNPNPN
jgi:hypothetical protein